jgi:YaiO family outer membrane protein
MIDCTAIRSRFIKALAFLPLALYSIPGVGQSLDNRRYAVALGVQSDQFSRFYNSQFLSTVDVSAYRDKGTYIFRVNEAERFNRSGVQIELEAYRKYKNGTYSWAGAAWSPSVLFPEAKWGAEYFFVPLKTWEASAGARLIMFDGELTQLFTASASKYSGSFLFMVRPFLVNNRSGSGFSLSGQARYYVNDNGTLAGLRFVAGASPERGFVQTAGGVQPEALRLLSQSAGVFGTYTIAKTFQLNAGIDVGRDELAFQMGSFTRRTSFQFGVRKAF